MRVKSILIQCGLKKSKNGTIKKVKDTQEGVSSIKPGIKAVPTPVRPTPGPQNAYNKIEAESLIDMNGIEVENEDGVGSIGYIQDRDYTVYNIDFAKGVSAIEVRAGSAVSGGKRV